MQNSIFCFDHYNMKPFKLIHILLLLLAIACNPKVDKTTSSTLQISDSTSANNIAEELTPEEDNNKLAGYKIDNINNIIALFRKKDIDKIASIINFPLNRQYPIPSIKDEREFKQRFNDVFDETLINMIAHSKTEQWSEVGWRGIMLDNGVVWIESDEGKIIAVNYQSDFEKKLNADLISKEKDSLHISLKKFERPTYKIKTSNYLIRIDEITNNTYRYASWNITEPESSKPDLILNNGRLEFSGSGGNHDISFLNGNYTYKIYRNIIAEKGAPDITLVVEKDGQEILTEGGMLNE